MSIEAMTIVGRSDIRPSGRKFVLIALANYADEEWSCFPSVEQIAAFTSQGEKTVRDHLDALEVDGIITRNRHRRADGTLGRYRFSIHRRNLPVANSARGEKGEKPAAEFATHNRHSEPSIGSSASASEFDQFWSIYPNKVGKRAAEKSFASARKRVGMAELMAGLNAYINKRDDRAWCNPATWLNQDRWSDQPAQAQPRGSPQSRPPSKAEVISNLRESLRHEHPADGRNPRPDGDHGFLLPVARRTG